MKLQGDIEVVEIRDYLTYFYWGRYPNDRMMDMRLGGGSFAIHKDGKAIVVDTMTRPGQGEWVRKFLEQRHQISQFTLVSSHWHVDHVVDNRVYSDSVIVGHKRTREVMLEKKQQFEAGQYSDYDAFEVVPPNLVFEGSLELWLSDIKVELHEYKVHEEGHLGVLLPCEKIFIANDILEDPIWIFNFDVAPPERQLMELERLKSQDIAVILPCHGSLEVIRNGGYTKELIQANINYLRAMLSEVGSAEFVNMAAEEFLQKELQTGVINWWEPYAEVHEWNKAQLLKVHNQK